jgi:hypothetical protein
MIKEAKPMFNFMGFREDADFEFFKGASFLFDEKYGEAKDCFNRLAKNGDSLAEAYYYWALSLEETQKKDRAKAVMTFRKCYESFKKSVPIYSWGILDERFDKGEKPLPMLPQACFVKDVILNRLEYSRKREVLVVARKPASSEEEKAEYEIWDIKGKKPAFKKVVDDLRNRNKRGKLDIFVDEDGAVYFKGKKVKELKKTQILYDFLLYFLKNKGVGGTYRELFVSVWEKGDVSISFTMNKYKKDNVIRMKNRLNTLLKDYEIKEVVYEYSKYRFPEDLEFCVIEKYIYEEHNQNQ